MTHSCIDDLIIIGRDNGLSPGRHKAIIWFNFGILIFGPLATDFRVIVIEIHRFAFKKMLLNAVCTMVVLSLPQYGIGTWMQSDGFTYSYNEKKTISSVNTAKFCCHTKGNGIAEPNLLQGYVFIPGASNTRYSQIFHNMALHSDYRDILCINRIGLTASIIFRNNARYFFHMVSCNAYFYRLMHTVIDMLYQPASGMVFWNVDITFSVYMFHPFPFRFNISIGVCVLHK